MIMKTAAVLMQVMTKMAASYGRKEIVELLLSHKAGINGKETLPAWRLQGRRRDVTTQMEWSCCAGTVALKRLRRSSGRVAGHRRGRRRR